MPTKLDPRSENCELSDPEPRRDPDNPARDHRNHHPEIEDEPDDEDFGIDVI